MMLMLMMLRMMAILIMRMMKMSLKTGSRRELLPWNAARPGTVAYACNPSTLGS